MPYTRNAVPSDFHGGTTASRLDQIWMRPPSGAEVTALNGAIVWQWAGRVDHDPAVADILFELPIITEVQEEPSSGWRWIKTCFEGPDRAACVRKVENAVERSRVTIGTAATNLQGARRDHDRDAATQILPEEFRAVEGIAPWYTEPDPRTPALRRTVSEAHKTIQAAMMDCLPKPPRETRPRQQRRATAAWATCTDALREAKNRLLFFRESRQRELPTPAMSRELMRITKRHGREERVC